MNRTRWMALVLALVFVGVNASWLSQDRLVRDGDEEGHVGAAELFLVDLAGPQPSRFVKRALVEDMGDYPSLYPASVGLWWWAAGGGIPGRPGVRAVNLVWLLGAAGALWIITRQLGLKTGAVAAVALLHLPLSAGLARHFMPEGALAATVTLAVAAACWQRARPTPARALLLGLVLGLGLLTKQTFPFYAAVPVLWAVRWRRSLAWALVGGLVVLPWLVHNGAEQWAYATTSAGYRGEGGITAHGLYYPLALVGLALGPVWTLLVAAAAG